MNPRCNIPLDLNLIMSPIISPTMNTVIVWKILTVNGKQIETTTANVCNIRSVTTMNICKILTINGKKIETTTVNVCKILTVVCKKIETTTVNICKILTITIVIVCNLLTVVCNFSPPSSTNYKVCHHQPLTTTKINPLPANQLLCTNQSL